MHRYGLSLFFMYFFSAQRPEFKTACILLRPFGLKDSPMVESPLLLSLTQLGLVREQWPPLVLLSSPGAAGEETDG